MTSTIRLGTASPGTQGTTAATVAQLELFARRAAGKAIDILLLPEAYIGGYPRGTHFGCVIGSRTQEGREEYLRYFQSAVDLGDTVGDGAGAGQAWVNRELPSDAIPQPDAPKQDSNRRGGGTREELERIAQETGIFIVTGLVEKAGGSLYCSVVYVCPKRGIIGKRRKVMPTGTERLVWAQGSPATLRAVSTSIRGVRINLAAAICWENYMPLVRQALYSQNINLYLAPTADDRDTWLPLLRTAAIEGRCFVVSSNMCVRRNPPLASSSSTDSHHTPAFHQNGTDTNTSGTEPDRGPTSTHRPNPYATEEALEMAPGAPPARRRQSIIDEDGNEIALPHVPRGAPPPTSRRKSVFDEDGNEIVLCADPSKRHHAQQKPIPAPRTPTTTITTTKPAFSSRGGSAIISPFGEVRAGPQWEDDEGLIYADVDFHDCIRGRLDLDTAGSYSRNDSFKFAVEGLDLAPLPY
ncbi:carbon-nitrogen hydrolase [Trichocladium antarcticum]|uniref:Carbon-nitrogen hydrolase n=1 Tax=Trichocladium antarcticum TaxID=1450529 RepID=A0AAN6ZFF2_9PEZI|nr:carbon-nitrogen hydrolase [Trichocladium antarcticum]